MAGERELIAAIARRAASSPAAREGAGARLRLGIGDDCAVWQADPAALSLVTTDTLIEGVHFDSSWHPPRLLGRKAVAVNISDIAAMGGTPRFVLLSLGLTGREAAAWREELLDGLVEATASYGARLIGGDTVYSPDRVMLTVTVLGEVAEAELCRRDGGREGDSLWVSGPLGWAAAGLELCRRQLGAEPGWQPLVEAHLDPDAQVALGRALAQGRLVHAMQDLSDGLATDLAHLAAASGLGAEVAAEMLPLPDLLLKAADHCEADPLTWAIAGGEDYQLLFSAPPEHDRAIAALSQQGRLPALHRIGRLVAGTGVFLRRGEQLTEIGYGGYEHFRPE
ncbi:MAG: thiamine-phosphate kinase [Desulfurivibrio sp.]|nr:thiamine-phosphate kinase [Desulfurivibrio sp.]